MDDKFMACFTNPIKGKLFSDIAAGEEMTAKKLARINGDIPQATLYRYLKRMLTDGVLEVVAEKQVRNVREKVYGVSRDFEAEIERILNENHGRGYLSLFQQFSNGLLKEFQAYAARENIDIKGDGSGFRIAPFYATVDELKELSHGIQELVRSYHALGPAPGRQMRNVAIVFTPPVT